MSQETERSLETEEALTFHPESQAPSDHRALDPCKLPFLRQVLNRQDY